MRGIVKAAILGVSVLTLAAPAGVAMARDGSPVNPKIIGGIDATEPYSFMASMQNNGGGHFCGGALIRPTWVLTAEHCMAGETPSGVQIRIGSNNRTSGGTVAKVKRFVSHSSADTALVELTAPVTHQPISIAAAVPPGTNVRLLGWGCTSSPNCGAPPVNLKQVDVPVLPDGRCGTDILFTICLENKDGKSACYGDSGGPLLVGTPGNWTLGGDTSGGPRVCGSGVFHYAELQGSVRTWIDSIAGPDGDESAKNLALNRPTKATATCNAEETGPKAVNGSVSGGNSDKWCSKEPVKTLDVDLGTSHALKRVVVRHAQAGGESAALNTRDFDLATSSDGTTWTPIATVRGNTAASTEHPVTATGRWLRLTVVTGVQSGDNIARIYELEAHA